MLTPLRTLAWLKRIALALERLALVEESRWEAERPREPRPRREVEVGVADVDEWNNRYDKQQREAGLR